MKKKRNKSKKIKEKAIIDQSLKQHNFFNKKNFPKHQRIKQVKSINHHKVKKKKKVTSFFKHFNLPSKNFPIQYTHEKLQQT